MLFIKSLFFALVFPGTAVGLVPWLLHDVWTFDAGLYRWIGAAPIAIGAPGILWCIVDFARVGRGTLATIDPPRFLVRRGPYRIVRNPMYIFVLLSVAGQALVWQTWAIACWACFLATAFHLFVVFYEEPDLKRRFGADYEGYLRTVPRWIPRFSTTPAPGSPG